jgi:hypothetical protein
VDLDQQKFSPNDALKNKEIHITLISKRSGLLHSLMLAHFAHYPASGASFLGFNGPLFFSIVGTFNSPTVPTALIVVFVGPVVTDTFVFITSSDPTILIVSSGGVTIPAGQSSATVLVSSVSLGTVTLTGSFDTLQAITTVTVVTDVPIVPVLNIEPLPGAVRLTWTTNAPSYMLETNSILTQPAGWGVLASNYSILNTNYIVINAISSDTMFYRLHKP